MTSPPTKILGGCVPGIPGGVDASGCQSFTSYRYRLFQRLVLINAVSNNAGLAVVLAAGHEKVESVGSG